MQIIVVGKGKLATELLGSLAAGSATPVLPWAQGVHTVQRSIVVHAGSGRELQAVLAYCAQTQSILIELATGSDLGTLAPCFPVVVCPNTNILMLKFMSMMEKCGPLFRNHHIELTESHQADKSSVPGTAVTIARALGLKDSDVRSVRDPALQETVLQIPAEHLTRHAYHQIRIDEGACSLRFEARVYGETAYVDGVARIVAAVQARQLENRLYSIMEFVDAGWL